jgi:hypothetical protein
VRGNYETGNQAFSLRLRFLTIRDAASLKHAKSLLSGIFTCAKNLGVLDGVNPVQGAIIPRKAAAPAKTHASMPDEVVAILRRAIASERRRRTLYVTSSNRHCFDVLRR